MKLWISLPHGDSETYHIWKKLIFFPENIQGLDFAWDKKKTTVGLINVTGTSTCLLHTSRTNTLSLQKIHQWFALNARLFTSPSCIQQPQALRMDAGLTVDKMVQ